VVGTGVGIASTVDPRPSVGPDPVTGTVGVDVREVKSSGTGRDGTGLDWTGLD
jgi:hypothetical protein